MIVELEPRDFAEPCIAMCPIVIQFFFASTDRCVIVFQILLVHLYPTSYPLLHFEHTLTNFTG